MRDEMLSGYWAAPLPEQVMRHADRPREIVAGLVLALLVLCLSIHLTIRRKP